MFLSQFNYYYLVNITLILSFLVIDFHNAWNKNLVFFFFCKFTLQFMCLTLTPTSISANFCLILRQKKKKKNLQIRTVNYVQKGNCFVFDPEVFFKLEESSVL